MGTEGGHKTVAEQEIGEYKKVTVGGFEASSFK